MILQNVCVRLVLLFASLVFLFPVHVLFLASPFPFQVFLFLVFHVLIFLYALVLCVVAFPILLLLDFAVPLATYLEYKRALVLTILRERDEHFEALEDVYPRPAGNVASTAFLGDGVDTAPEAANGATDEDSSGSVAEVAQEGIRLQGDWQQM